MKTQLLHHLGALVVATAFLFVQVSCIVVTKKDNGKHKGWFKKSHHPHHPASANSGHSKGKGKK